MSSKIIGFDILDIQILGLSSQLCGQKSNTFKLTRSLLVEENLSDKWGKMKDILFVKKMHLPGFATQKPESVFDEEWGFEH
ncbi:hypothetical protein CR513_40371, partial [Mucuna pruriens]